MKYFKMYNFYVILIVLTVYTLFFVYIFNRNYNPLPGALSITKALCFVDLNVVIGSTQCYNHGFDPYINKNSFCEHDYNYPRLWIYIFDFLGVKLKHIYFIGFSLIFIFVLMVANMFTVNNVKKMVLVVSLFFLPPILFLLERNNVDLIIFNILLFSIFYVSKVKNIQLQMCIKYGLILIAAFLKMYPCFLFLLVYTENISLRYKNYYFITLSTLFVIYLIVIRNELFYIAKNSLYSSEWCFGKNVLIEEIVSKSSLPFYSILPFIVSTFFIFYFFKNKMILFLNEVEINSVEFKLFFSGLILYLGQFFIGNHYDLRLVFLFLTLPLLLSQFSKHKTNRKFVLFFLINLFILFTFSFVHLYVIPFKNYQQWFIGRNSFMILKYISSTIIASYSFLIIYLVLKTIFINLFRGIKSNL